MKKLIIVFLYFSILSITVSGQKQKLPPEGTLYGVSDRSCDYSNQTGKLEVIKDDSQKVTIFQTDSTKMILYASHFLGFLTDIDNVKEADSIYVVMDSLISTLFTNGLLTSDLLISSFNIENKLIDHNGDTVDFTQHINASTVKILNIKRKKLPRKYNGKRGTIMFEIWVTFNPYESGWGSFPMFNLYLKSEVKLKEGNLTEYLNEAEIKCLKFTGFQI